MMRCSNALFDALVITEQILCRISVGIFWNLHQEPHFSTLLSVSTHSNLFNFPSQMHAGNS